MARILTAEQIASACAKAGFTGENLVIAVAIAIAESGGNAEAVGDSGMSFGLFQINAHAHPDLIPGWSHTATKEQNIAACTKAVAWYDPVINAKMAYKISGGHIFRAWSVYIHETYKNKLPQARSGVAAYLNTAPPTSSTKPYLRYGSVGQDVKLLQTILNAAGYTPALEVDGIFGPKTLAGVKWFQAKMRIEVDGIVGPITWGKLMEVRV